jgi:transposase InsO family protein
MLTWSVSSRNSAGTRTAWLLPLLNTRVVSVGPRRGQGLELVVVDFVVDAYARHIVGWRVTASMSTDFVLDALEQALYGRQPECDSNLLHSDRGSQYASIRYGERLAEAGVEPSVGSKGDSYDNALAEIITGCTRLN